MGRRFALKLWLQMGPFVFLASWLLSCAAGRIVRRNNELEPRIAPKQQSRVLRGGGGGGSEA
ncbi:hypothetical protein EJ05DRAFT_156823 [Pseudovirgaria hyperparasitica]|uniref:Uncharacterized protein n=1 Tax=Pseudovirgaria hyperparasitica TaxID=470096 RepID=A0A6A6VX71_9PEZI|nr:uncharacterized protein EJ05DRAFT_156823 [Pseudovirgaria hyperparasitica]KAF2753841.1 hypothetical protein EJ05DRAFT_156823 [Pseudovirgaria hyperparasitica]